MEVKDIIELMKAVSENGLTKFELEQGETKIVMKREKEIIKTLHGADSMVYTKSAEEQRHVQPEEKMLTGNIISCPLVGTFYTSPAPDADSFVKVGDRVKKGQVVGIVEAMKLMNEIESEYDGIVEEILVNNEDTVEYGQPLIVVR
ncbi:MAG: acetyl-CoA carboxylase biotin carboxyl carrier protein [Lachnospiraceae bacterium]|nr:acetyl-CoA carboxylase biotin carboxyl carrier protein [Lachnospiraceae bacterium]